MGGWIGVDLDGTLAVYGGWKGPDHIGEPVPAIKELVLKFIDDGKEVKIFTARASIEDQVAVVKEWLKNNGFPDLEVTNVKDFTMISLYDDRAITVEHNTGKILTIGK